VGDTISEISKKNKFSNAMIEKAAQEIKERRSQRGAGGDDDAKSLAQSQGNL